MAFPPGVAGARLVSSTRGLRLRVFATPFVAEPAMCSPVVGTIDLEGVDADTVRPCCGPTASSTPSSYRKLGRNQFRIGMFPAVEPHDVDARSPEAIDSWSRLLA